MTATEAKKYVNKRFIELSAANPKRSRAELVNDIIRSLRYVHNFTLTTPFGHRILGITEDDLGIIYHI
jgi:hypothetical protein